MKLSEDRILFLAREALNHLQQEKLAEISNFPLALRQGRELLAQWGQSADRIDLAARRKISSLKRNVVEGSAEWQILYRRFRDEEARKKGPR